MPRTGADEYDERFARLAAAGHDVHGEAALMASLGVRSVLDAGCGTGRVARELARRGIDVLGVDLQRSMLEVARRKAPDIPWVQGDVALVRLNRQFEAVLLAGNVMLFVAAGTEGTVLANLAAHLVPGGLLVAGFSLGSGLTPEVYDALAGQAGLVALDRWATWDRGRFADGADYVVCVHALGDRSPTT